MPSFVEPEAALSVFSVCAQLSSAQLSQSPKLLSVGSGKSLWQTASGLLKEGASLAVGPSFIAVGSPDHGLVRPEGFGQSVLALGDLDGDGASELGVTLPNLKVPGAPFGGTFLILKRAQKPKSLAKP